MFPACRARPQQRRAAGASSREDAGTRGTPPVTPPQSDVDRAGAPRHGLAMTTPASGRLIRIARFPVKGLSPQPLEAAELAPGRPLPGARRFALAHGASAFEPAHPGWQKKAHFLN